jgi:drug/metabolite transporter (DMT)-like permease
MIYLFVISLIWAFSFGLIKDQVASLDANFVAAARLLISLVVFIPFLRLRGISRKLGLRLTFTGAVQYGLMYITYLYAFRFLQAYEVALFTIFTPLFVTLINDLLRKRLHLISLLATLIAIAGTAVVKQADLFRPELLTGFLIVQISNLSFAFGQIYYTELMKNKPQLANRSVFGLLYLGGVLTAGLPAIFTAPWGGFQLDTTQILTLLYLGAIASGVGFFLWNVGARKVNAGTLAIFNDLKIPLAVAVSLIFFGEKTDLPSLFLGGAIVLAALVLNEWGIRRMGRKLDGNLI